MAVGLGWMVPASGAASAAPISTTMAPSAVAPSATVPSATAPSTTTATGSSEGLGPLVLTQPLPGFTVSVAGPTNGTLTSTEFASQSSNPTQAEQQFDTLSAQPGFAGFIRLWTDRDGPGAGANDVAILLFHISERPAAQTFASGLSQPFAGATGSMPFAVPSIQGARGYSVVVTSPVPAVERVVVFRAGQYVAMVELASTSASTNPAPLTAAQAVSVSFLQLGQLRAVDPSGAVDPSVPARVRTAPTSPLATSGGGVSTAIVMAAVLAVLIVGLVVLLILRLRRRPRSAPTIGPTADGDTASGDPWLPGGVFAELADLSGPAELAGSSVQADDAASVNSGIGSTPVSQPQAPVRVPGAGVPAATSATGDSPERSPQPVPAWAPSQVGASPD